jgi:hypothetical protein
MGVAAQMTYRYRRASFTSLLTLAVVLTTVAHGYAGDPDASCSPWFVGAVEFDRATFPAGLVIENRDDPDLPYHTDLLENLPASVTNSGATPVYIFAHGDRGFALKLVGNQTYYTNYRVSPENIASNKIGWHPFPHRHYQITVWILNYLTGVHVRGGCGDDRPSDIQAPESQPFSINIVVGERRSTIDGRVAYRLNERYDPTAQARDPIYQGLLRQQMNARLERIPLAGTFLVIANDHRWLAGIAAFVVIALLVLAVLDSRRPQTIDRLRRLG